MPTDLELLRTARAALSTASDAVQDVVEPGNRRQHEGLIALDDAIDVAIGLADALIEPDTREDTTR